MRNIKPEPMRLIILLQNKKGKNHKSGRRDSLDYDQEAKRKQRRQELSSPVHEANIVGES